MYISNNNAWRCPQCETLNHEEICTVCGMQKPIKSGNEIKRESIEDNTEKPKVKHNNHKKLIIVMSIIALCIVTAIVGYGSYNTYIQTNPHNVPGDGLVIDDYLSLSNGLPVYNVVADSPADKCGIKIGDVIDKCDGKKVRSIKAFNTIKMKHQYGDTMIVTVNRQGETLDLELILEK